MKEGETLPRGSAGRTIMTNVVGPGFFNTMQIPFVEGRDFDERDQPKTQGVIVVNQKMAEMLWPGESAIGKRVFIGTESRDALEVIGVVKTGKYRALAEDPKPFFYYTMGQRRPAGMALVVRGSVDPRSLVGPIRGEVQALDRRVPVYAVKTMSEHMTYALWAPNMAASFSLAFGVLAVLLSAVGLYSVMAYVVSQRTREVGIRMALGADRSHVLKMITKQGMWLAGIGVGIGMVLSLALVRVLSSLLIGVSGYDPLIFVLVPLLLGSVAFVASYLPARRATKVNFPKRFLCCTSTRPLSTGTTSGFDDCHAGASPNTKPVASETTSVNRRARESTAKKSLTIVYSSTGTKPCIRSVTHSASNNPRPPPITANSKLSVSS